MSRKSKAETSLVDRIVDQLKTGDLDRRELARRIGIASGSELRSALAYLVESNRIKCSAVPYGKPAAYSLIADYSQVVKKIRRPERPRTNSGSGVIAGPVQVGRGFRWGSGW